MEMGIYTLLNDDEELMGLYQTDATLKKSIDAGYRAEMDTDAILISALKNGYKAKQEIFNSFVEYKTYECMATVIKED